MPSAITNGVRIRHEVEGSGPPLVLHIGYIGGLEDWVDAGYVAPLARCFRVLRHNPRRQGQSDAPHDPAAYAAPVRVGDILAVLDAEGIEQAHFRGYSLGGWIGFALGVYAPDRVASLIIGGAQPCTGNPLSVDGDVFLDGLRDGMVPFVAASSQTTRLTVSRPASAIAGLPQTSMRCAPHGSPI